MMEDAPQHPSACVVVMPLPGHISDRSNICSPPCQSDDVWIAWMASAMVRGEHAYGKEILQRAVSVLPTSQHVGLISKFGQLEFK